MILYPPKIQPQKAMDDVAVVEGLTTSTPFLSKLWRLLSSNETNNEIEWDETGTQVIIKDGNTLATKWMQPYGYRSNQYSSFQRQLNYFGFAKISSDPYMVYQHDLFQRDKPELTQNLKRKTNTGNINKMRKTKREKHNKAAAEEAKNGGCVVCGAPDPLYMSTKYEEYPHVPSKPVCNRSPRLSTRCFARYRLKYIYYT